MARTKLDAVVKQKWRQSQEDEAIRRRDRFNKADRHFAVGKRVLLKILHSNKMIPLYELEQYTAALLRYDKRLQPWWLLLQQGIYNTFYKLNRIHLASYISNSYIVYITNSWIKIIKKYLKMRMQKNLLYNQIKSDDESQMLFKILIWQNKIGIRLKSIAI